MFDVTNTTSLCVLIFSGSHKLKKIKKFEFSFFSFVYWGLGLVFGLNFINPFKI